MEELFTNLTPIERYDGIYFKREDKFELYGLNGAKTRGAYYLIQKGVKLGFTKFTTCGARDSMQMYIVASLCKQLGYEFVGHAPQGELPESFKQFNIIQHRAGYNNVIAARAKEYAHEEGAYMIPFGLLDRGLMALASTQVNNIPKGVQRIIVPVGGAVNLCGVLIGLQKIRCKLPVLGVVVGRDPTRTLASYAPWGYHSRLKLVPSGMPYGKHAEIRDLYGVPLDPVYEAKCVPFVEKGDLLWIIGLRNF